MESIKEELSRPTVFTDESVLSLEYVPRQLPHRGDHLRFLTQLFRFQLERPGSMSQRVLITGDVGTGKTVLSQRFGMDLMKEAKSRKINLRYVHVNCRESRGSLFLILKRVIAHFIPRFPQRGFSSEELLRILVDILDDKKAYLILALDEMDSLIRNEGASPIYSLTRIQEQQMNAPIRLSLISILKDLSYLQKLDRSTLGTLQQNFIKLERYAAPQLETILKDRVTMALKEDAISEENIGFIADLASSNGDARYAIELLWRSGKYADSDDAREVTSEHIRKASGSIHPAFREEYLNALSLHEKLLLLAVSRSLKGSGLTYTPIGEVELSYKMACEEYGEDPRGHTQIWKYVQNLSATGVLSAQRSGKGHRGKTTLIGLPFTSASEMGRWLEAGLEALKKFATRRYRVQ